MSWYRIGTVTVTNGSTTVTGSGTAFIANASIGEGLIGPDGRTYEITNITSDTSLTISPAYLGSTASGQAYAVAPLRGRIADLIAETGSLLASFSAVRDGIGVGQFPDGSPTSPAFRFTNDQDTGIYRATNNVLGFATGGVGRAFIDGSGNIGLGTSTPYANIDISTFVASETTLAIRMGYAGDFAGFRLANTNTASNTSAGLFRIQRGTASAWVDSLVVNNIGNVGIGTTSPAARLSVAAPGGVNALSLTGDFVGGSTLTINPFITGVSGSGAEFVVGGFGTAISISPSGNVGIGFANPMYVLDVKKAAGSGGQWEVARLSNDQPGTGCNMTLVNGAGHSWDIGLGSSDAFTIRRQSVGVMTLSSDSVGPGIDGGVQLGVSFRRWSTVFAVTGTINTSDEREKHWRGELNSNELRAAKRIIGELGIYQWNDAVAEKGEDGARLHFGVRAQRAFQILEEEGLDWRRYAWCCYDQWEDQLEAELDAEGQPTGETRVTVPAGDRYGIRPDQLAFWLIAAQAKIQEDLEARIAALEA